MKRNRMFSQFDYLIISYLVSNELLIIEIKTNSLAVRVSIPDKRIGNVVWKENFYKITWKN